MSDQPIWCVMPAVSNPDMTEAAIADLLAQSVPTRVLLILQGVTGPFRQRMEAIAEQEPRLLVWSHDPALPSLSATWNRALKFVWETGGTEALVVNNDVKLNSGTVSWLNKVLHREQALFVTAVGVTAEQFSYETTYDYYSFWDAHSDKENAGFLLHRGGPDFSCFLISRACHEKYQFDEAIVPCFSEDLDYHRRLMLGGDGDRIFSINLPYLHIGGGSQTLKSMSPEARAARERQIDGARAYYTRKWGGGVNQERWTIPFEPMSDQAGVTTPDLQRAIQGAQDVPADPPPVPF